VKLFVEDPGSHSITWTNRDERVDCQRCCHLEYAVYGPLYRILITLQNNCVNAVSLHLPKIGLEHVSGELKVVDKLYSSRESDRLQLPILNANVDCGG
jgi:hypothetical protein